MNPLLRTEFHSHTLYSTDGLMSPEVIVARAKSVGIDRLIVTDHNTIQGALAAYAIDPQHVIVGEEVQTQKGELLAAFVTEEVPGYLTPMETLRRLRDQGAFISVSHPFDPVRSGWSVADLVEMLPFIDAIETFNARCASIKMNFEAEAFAREHGIAGTAGSDAHMKYELGRANLLLPEFSTPSELRSVIRQGKPIVRMSPHWVHLGSRYAVVTRNRRRPEGFTDPEHHA
jgi:predicted metal-dependent phosphoesterase TrpH